MLARASTSAYASVRNVHKSERTVSRSRGMVRLRPRKEIDTLGENEKRPSPER